MFDFSKFIREDGLTLESAQRTLTGGSQTIFSILVTSPWDRNLGLSTRLMNALRWDGISSIAEAITKTEGELLRVKYLGRTSLREFVESTQSLGLHLNMTYAPDLAAELARVLGTPKPCPPEAIATPTPDAPMPVVRRSKKTSLYDELKSVQRTDGKLIQARIKTLEKEIEIFRALSGSLAAGMKVSVGTDSAECVRHFARAHKNKIEQNEVREHLADLESQLEALKMHNQMQLNSSFSKVLAFIHAVEGMQT